MDCSELPKNIADTLFARAKADPQLLAVSTADGRVKLTYRDLADLAERYQAGLRAAGITPGMRTVLMVPPSLPFFGLTFALFKLGAVPVLIDPGMGLRPIGRCLAEAEPTAFVGIGKAHAARWLFGWGRASLRHLVMVEDWSWPGVPTLTRLSHQAARRGLDSSPTAEAATAGTAPEGPAAILFTSGSTGPPKGAVYSHAIFGHQVRLLREMYAIQVGEVDLCTFPLFALFAPALGMSAIIPKMDPTRPARVHPPNIVDPVRQFGVTNLFGSPALLRRVGKWAEGRDITLPSVKRVISAGAPVAARVIETFQQLLPEHAEIHTPYGATESLPVATIGSREILGETRAATDRGQGVCVGQPAPAMEVAILRISDDPIPVWADSLRQPAGSIGEIAVRGPVVTREYFRRPEATALAKIADGTGGVWHRMGDLGYRDAAGRIWFCGRKAHRVQTAAGELYTIPCEGVFNTHPQVFRTALVGVAGRPVLCVELEKSGRAKASQGQIRRELLEIGARYPHTAGIRDVLFHPSFPVDIRHNAKIFREKLAVWAAEKLA